MHLRRQRGFSLLELMVTVAIAAILLGLGVSAFSNMVASSKSRNVAESLVSGLRLARAEAVKRNVPMQFQLVDSLDNTCNFNSGAGIWIVSQVDVVATHLVPGHCSSAPFTPPDQADICNPDIPLCTAAQVCPVGQPNCCRGVPLASPNNKNPPNCTDDPLIAFKSDGGVPVSSVTVAALGAGAAAYAVTFSPIGRVIANADASTPLDQLDITPVGYAPTDSTAKSWRIRVLSGSGSIKLCDPNAPTSALACP